MTTADKVMYAIAAIVVLATQVTVLWVVYIMYFKPSVEISGEPVLTATAAPTRPPKPTATPTPTKAISTSKPVKATSTPVPPTPTPKAAPATPTPVPPSPTLAPTLTLEEQLAQSLHAPWAAQDWAEVIRLGEQILAINPDYDDMVQKLYAAHVNYGRDLAAEGRLEEAKWEFIRALYVKPDRGEAVAELAALAGETPRPLPVVLPGVATPTPQPVKTTPRPVPPTTVPPTPTPVKATPTPRPTETPAHDIKVIAIVYGGDNLLSGAFSFVPPNTRVCAAGKILADGKPARGVYMKATWHFKDRDDYCAAITNTIPGFPESAAASCCRSSGSFQGYTVEVDVVFTYEGKDYGETAAFRVK